MPDYSKTIIYKICCNDANITDIYIGHTTNLTRRKYRHKQCCLKPEINGGKSKCYETIRENGGWDNWSLIQMELYSCANTNEARARERYWIELLKPSLNHEIPNRTNKEWFQDTIEIRKEINKKKWKKYHEKNKDKLNEKKREKICCDICNATICSSGIARHKKEVHNGKKRTT